jgi:DNA-binding CsgD family transcriptional regulator
MIGRRVPAGAFVGREAELSVISAAVESAARGRAQVVWVEGAAGSGKSALTRRAVEQLEPNFQVLRAFADEDATEVAYDVVRQLGASGTTEAFATGMELLDVLSTRQDTGPVVVVIEDLHWADPGSRQALLTAARRLHDDSVVLLVTSRPASGHVDGWDRLRTDPDRCVDLRLGALTVADVGALAEATGLALSGSAVERLTRHTEGHALYVRTLLSELSIAQMESPDEQLPAPRSLASMTIALLAGISVEAQGLASALAVVNHPDSLDVLGRIADVADPSSALEQLLATGLVTWSRRDVGTRVEFAHPLYRTAVYDDLSPTRRRALHLAAAELDHRGALAHRVAAADSFDDTLAAELACAADAEIEAGALGLGARDLLWASALTSNRDESERRLLDASRVLFTDGQNRRVQARREQIESTRPSGRRSLVLGVLSSDDGDAEASHTLLAEAIALEHADGGGSELIAEAHARRAGVFSLHNRGQDAVDEATKALDLEPATGDVVRMAWWAMAIGEAILHGAPAGVAILDAHGTALLTAAASHPETLAVRGMCCYFAGQRTQAIRDLRAAINSSRRGSLTAHRPRAHLYLALSLVQAGEWDEALLQGNTALSLVTDEHDVWIEPPAHAALAGLMAGRGSWDDAASHLGQAQSTADALGTIEAFYMTQIARAALARARDDPAGMVEALAPLIGDGDSRNITMFTQLAFWPNLIEALIAGGEIDAADRQIAQLDVAATDRGLNFSARLSGLRARMAVAQGDLAQAATEFDRAVSTAGDEGAVLDWALIHHAYGRVRRDQGRQAEAVQQFGIARDQLAALGAVPYQIRVESDLELVGVPTAPPAQRTPFTLTPREQDVVVLVAKGYTNAEVAEALYVSKKAVEYHLGNVFNKLGISSRRELRGWTPDEPPESSPHLTDRN